MYNNKNVVISSSAVRRPRLELPILEVNVLDHSIASTLERCPRLALYKYGLGRSVEYEDTVSSDFGTAYHGYRERLEKIYQEAPEGIDIKKIHALAKGSIVNQYQEPDLENKKSHLDKAYLADVCDLAFQKWSREKTSGHYKTIATEVSFELPLPYSGRSYGGRFDEIVEWNGKLWVRDFKTKSWLPSVTNSLYELDHQMSGYIWAAGQTSGRKIEGVLVEIVHILKNKRTIIPIMATRTSEDIEQFFEWAEHQWDVWEECRDTGRWPMHATTCHDFMKKCSFFDACKGGTYAKAIEWCQENTIEKVWDFRKAQQD